jgi:hypothetical protein
MTTDSDSGRPLRGLYKSYSVAAALRSVDVRRTTAGAAELRVALEVEGEWSL